MRRCFTSPDDCRSREQWPFEHVTCNPIVHKITLEEPEVTKDRALQRRSKVSKYNFSQKIEISVVEVWCCVLLKIFYICIFSSIVYPKIGNNTKCTSIFFSISNMHRTLLIKERKFYAEMCLRPVYENHGNLLWNLLYIMQEIMTFKFKFTL